MRFFLKMILVTSGICTAFLFWWRPAQNLISITPVDWNQKYDKEVLHPKAKFGVMGMADALIRNETEQPSLEKYIQQETLNQLTQTDSEAWKTWARKRFSNQFLDIDQPEYFRRDNPLMSAIDYAYGYLEIKDNDKSYFARFNQLDPDELEDKNIPENLRYPNRKVSIILFCLVFLYLFISKFQMKTRDLVGQSTAATGTKVFMGIFIAGASLVIMPFLYGWFNDSPPFVFMGGFIVIVGIIGLSMFGWQMIFTENLINKGKDLLVHWTFETEDWKKITEKEYKTESSEKRGLLLFISAIILFVGVVFWLIMRDSAAGIVFLVLLGVIGILTFVAVLVPWLTYRRNMKQTGEIFIGKDGVYLNGAIHTWTLAGSRLESVELLQKPFFALGITYSFWMSAGRIPYLYRSAATIRLPVPRGKEEEAKNIISQLMPTI